MSEEGKLCHDSAYPLSLIKNNIYLIRLKKARKGLSDEELNKRLDAIEEQNNKLYKYIDEFYTLCKTLRNENKNS